jgi:hypothetical protein
MVPKRAKRLGGITANIAECFAKMRVSGVDVRIMVILVAERVRRIIFAIRERIPKIGGIAVTLERGMTVMQMGR